MVAGGATQGEQREVAGVMDLREPSSIADAELPDALVEREQWVCWREEQRDGKPTKVPVTPGSDEFASSTDSDTWSSFEAAVEYLETGDFEGVGFVFTDDDPIVGVDLDDCREPDTGEAEPPAPDIIDRLDSYTEVSPSGTGFHVLLKGELPEGRNRRGSVELYDSARYFTVTGKHVEGTPLRVARRQDALEAIHREYVQETESCTGSDTNHTHVEDGRSDSDASVDVDLNDEDLLEKARNASNGEKFQRLWNGQTRGYESHSEADLALCSLLAFWTGGDRSQIDRLFRQSGLMREKWDEVHYADGSTYGEKTIERAVAGVSEHYDPEAVEGLDSMTEPTGTGSAGQRHAHLAEKNRLLTERIAELETKLEAKEERIAELEAELDRLDDR